MKINWIKRIKTIIPEGSCGTGYSQPDIFEINYDDNKTKEVYIDIWYLPIHLIKDEFKKSLSEEFTLENIENLDETFEMYAEQIENYSCHWTKKQILRANKSLKIFN